MIDIIVISDIKIYCEGLSQILAGTSYFNVTGSVNNHEAALDLIADSLPDVVLLDMTMAGNCHLAQQISHISDDIKIVALAVPYDENNILQCAEAGITCYVLREASIDELIKVVVVAAKGECYCPPKIAACILKKVKSVALSAKRKYLPFKSDTESLSGRSQHLQTRLTRREREISSLLSEGLSNKQIARDLSIEVSTVKNHVHNILVKLEVQSRCQAVSLLQKVTYPRASGSMDLDPYLKISS